MNLLDSKTREALLSNGKKVQDHEVESPETFEPVVKLSTENGRCVWLVGTMDPKEPDRLYALYDVGVGDPRMEYIHLSSLERVQKTMKLHIAVDKSFVPSCSLLEYYRQSKPSRRLHL